ncbi:hypothetical protein KM043_017010 [Ampulex compressa]|nr:hypothetical protein KM043_017010 [Ampulex compressa]
MSPAWISSSLFGLLLLFHLPLCRGLTNDYLKAILKTVKHIEHMLTTRNFRQPHHIFIPAPVVDETPEIHSHNNLHWWPSSEEVFETRKGIIGDSREDTNDEDIIRRSLKTQKKRRRPLAFRTDENFNANINRNIIAHGGHYSRRALTNHPPSNEKTINENINTNINKNSPSVNDKEFLDFLSDELE